MKLQYPSYLNRNPETIQGSGNAFVPEGTLIKWLINANATSKIDFVYNSITKSFTNSDASFTYSLRINNALDYEIITSNDNVTNFEKLKYQITIIKDAYPSINAQFAPDSLKLKSKVVVGQITDDYGLSKLQVVYYDKNKPTILNKYELPIKKEAVDRFIYTFQMALV
ncbi:MAG: hypothetical protein HC854_06890 [Flavobacterium sp.]|nr:hypothetical protein [Flavobacterium sp.]